MASAKKLQHKIFGTPSSSIDTLRPSPSDPRLTINIPKPTSSPSLVQPKKQVNETPKVSRSAGVESNPKNYRDRLTTQLESEYESVERHRLAQDQRRERHWKRWGPYLSERQWVRNLPSLFHFHRLDSEPPPQATVREDYSANGDAWTHFPHAHSRSRAYRWGEDGLAGLCDNHQRLCFCLGLWNGVDPILKERLFGVTGHEGNHGEDCKELYYYLDSTPTHSYMKFLYKYPQRPFPYEELVRESTRRGRDVKEFEILDTEAFDEDRYWDVFVEYAKDEDDPDAISIRITAFNRGPDPATLHILPQLWFPNTWSWPVPRPPKPVLHLSRPGTVSVKHPKLRTNFYCIPSPPPAGPPSKSGEAEELEGENITPDILFTENETNFERLWGGRNEGGYAKDGFHDHIIPSHRPAQHQKSDLGDGHADGVCLATPDASPQCSARLSDGQQNPYVNPANHGTKAAGHYVFKDVPGNGGCVVVRCKMTPKKPAEDPAITDEEAFDDTVEERRGEADEFYGKLAVGPLSDDFRGIMRQALSGMLWTKQFYKFIQAEWLNGDPAQPPPPPERKYVRNKASFCYYIWNVSGYQFITSSRTGNTCTLRMSCRCLINGNTPSSPPGIPPSIASHSLWSILPLRRSNSISSRASGT